MLQQTKKKKKEQGTKVSGFLYLPKKQFRYQPYVHKNMSNPILSFKHLVREINGRA